MKTTFLTKWRERLSEPQGVYTYRDKAMSWMTCATGDRVFQEMGRRSKNYSDDLSYEARKLGIAFTDAVKNQDTKLAQNILEQIENLPSLWFFDVKKQAEETTKPKRKAKPKKRKPRA